jgi:hypothetical protein
MTELLTHPNSVTAGQHPVMAAPPPPPGGRDFSRQRKRLTFTMDGDTFEAAPALPGDIYAEFVTLYNSTGETDTYQEQHDLLKRALQLALLDDSFQRFTARLKDKTKPIDDDQMADVVIWLLEEYGMRPTQPSPDSSDGSASPESGTNSTANTPPAESTSATSEPTAS